MPKLVTVSQLSTAIPALSQAGIRWLIFTGKENGLEESGAVIRLGRRVLIDEEKFIAWVASHGANGKVRAHAERTQVTADSGR